MSAISFKCPNCDGELVFDPATQKYKCEYCCSYFQREEINGQGAADEPKAEDAPETAGAEESEEEKEAREAGAVYACPSCGAEIVTDETTAATFCYYCHNPVVLSGRLSGEFLPDRVIPFAIDKEAAKQKFIEFFRKQKGIPRSFFNKKQMKKISGIYFPYFTYSSHLKGRLEAEGIKRRVWMQGDYEYTEKSVYRVEREGDIFVKDLAKNALTKTNHVLMEGILPYDLSEAKPFDMGYLSGFLAEKRDVGESEATSMFQSDAGARAKTHLRGSVWGYWSLDVENCEIFSEKGELSYVFLPVWTLTYQGKDGTTYYYSMNGQTGKVCGKFPVDYIRPILPAVLTGIVTLFIMIAGGCFLW